MEQEFFDRFPSTLALASTAEAKAALPITDAGKATKQELFVVNYVNAAIKAAKTFGISPLALLAQGAIESGWGTSTLAKNFNNFFGITAAGKPNQFWRGQFYTSKSSGLKFRVYSTLEAGFSDFARIISTYYKDAALASTNINAYANKIAHSPYISEKNGDNRANYERMIVSAAKTISGHAKKKYPQLNLI